MADKTVSYRSVNTYTTLNELGPETKRVWIVLHGIGYLSRYFIRPFGILDPQENFIIAPQAPAKYYLTTAYKHVGASWLTRESLQMEIENGIAYLDALFKEVKVPEHCELIILGFSQGVSMASRWVSKSKIGCSQFILVAGGIPVELQHSDFEFLSDTARIRYFIGDKDEFLTAERLQTVKGKLQQLFGERAEFSHFQGKHEITPDFVKQLFP